MKKVKIIFDNNSSIVSVDKPISGIFSNSVYKLSEFIKKNKIEGSATICLTNTFSQEGIAELQERARSIYKGTRILKGILAEGLIKEIDEKELLLKVKNQYDEKAKELNIEVLALPKITVEELSQRAINYKPPFKKEDRGFKDSVAWFSIMEDAEKNKDTDYILVTKDGIFDKRVSDEFLNKIGKEITIIPPEPVEEVLDEVLDLGFDLEKVSNQVKKYLDKDSVFQNKLKEKALEKLSSEDIHSGFIYRSSVTNGWESKVVNLVFEDVTVNIKNKIDKNSYEVEATVVFKPKYSGGNEVSSKSRIIQSSHIGEVVRFDTDEFLSIPGSFSAVGSYQNFNPKKIQQKFTLSFNKKTDDLNILSVGEVSSGGLFGFL